MVVLDGSVLNNGFAGVGSVGFFACANEFDLYGSHFDHGGAKRLKDREFGTTEFVGNGLRKFDAAALHNNVDVL